MDNLDRNLEKNPEKKTKSIEKDRIRSMSNENLDRLRITDDKVETKINRIALSGKEGKDHIFNDLGKQYAEVSKIDLPDVNDKNFVKYSRKEMEEYILHGGLEKIKESHPIKLLKFEDRYCVDIDGHKRVFLANKMSLEKIPANIKELKILRKNNE